MINCQNAITKKEYLLMVAQYQPKKNIDRLFEAYEGLDLEKKPKLIAILPGYRSRDVLRGVELIIESIGHRELAEYYQGAIAFVFLSLHETFGIPIVEAMACGCPVITSNLTACPEIAGGAAITVNPYSVEKIKNDISRIIQDKQPREELTKKGLERSKDFTWEKRAKQHLEVFEKAIKSNE